MSRPKVWNDEERDILNKAKGKPYKFVKDLLKGHTIEELQILAKSFKDHANLLGYWKNSPDLTPKQRMNEQQIYKTLYKQASRIIEYKLRKETESTYNIREIETQLDEKIHQIEKDIRQAKNIEMRNELEKQLVDAKTKHEDAGQKVKSLDVYEKGKKYDDIHSPLYEEEKIEEINKKLDEEQDKRLKKLPKMKKSLDDVYREYYGNG